MGYKELACEIIRQSIDDLKQSPKSCTESKRKEVEKHRRTAKAFIMGRNLPWLINNYGLDLNASFIRKHVRGLL